jgi:hypothetical protein
MRHLFAPGLLVGLFALSFGFAVPSAPPPTSSDRARIHAEITRIEEAMPKSSDRGAGLFLLATEYVRLGDWAKAISLLKKCISLDEGFDPSGSIILSPLRSSPEFEELIAEVRARRAPVQRAQVAFTFPADDLFPEGLAVDADRHIFYMGSMHRKKLVMRAENGQISDFVKPGVYNLLGLGGMKVDPGDHSLWAASDNDQDSELLHFDMHGKLLELFSPPRSRAARIE